MDHKVYSITSIPEDFQDFSSTAKRAPAGPPPWKERCSTRHIIGFGLAVCVLIGTVVALVALLCHGYKPSTKSESDSEAGVIDGYYNRVPEQQEIPGGKGLDEPEAAPMVYTQFGPVRGSTVVMVRNGGPADTIYTYHSIPYAKPPVGPLRWRKPEDPYPWYLPIDGTQLPPMCIQNEWAIRGTHSGWDRFSEDCLYLNVYRPMLSCDGGLCPVMVYLHGGGFQVSGSIQYPGHYYAHRGVIMVNLNYRLGFASTDEPELHSNYGIWDMLKAVQFVKNNIQYFGGDPNKITIFGESAGSIAVGLFMVSPHTAGLFHQALYTSGAETAFWAVNDPSPDDEIMFLKVAENHGCEGRRYDNERTLNCMREIDPIYLFENSVIDCPNCRTYGVVIDGPGGFVPELPLRMRERGLGHPVPIMAGTTADENSPAPMAIDPTLLVRGMNRTEFKHLMYRMVEEQVDVVVPGGRERIHEALLLAYSPWPMIDHGVLNKINFGHVTSDALFGAPTNQMLNFHLKKAKCYQYVFDVKPTLLLNPLPRWIGVPHAFDIPYVFAWPQIQNAPAAVQEDTGNLRLPTVVTFVANDRHWSNYMIDLWTNFAKYGDPTPDAHPLTPPGQRDPAKWKEQTEYARWWFHIDNEPTPNDLAPTRSKNNWKALETATQLNYANHLATGADLHNDLVSSPTGAINPGSYIPEYYKVLLMSLNWQTPKRRIVK